MAAEPVSQLALWLLLPAVSLFLIAAALLMIVRRGVPFNLAIKGLGVEVKLSTRQPADAVEPSNVDSSRSE